MENNQLKHGENCCPSHWNLMRIFLSASSREEHSHNILFILQRFLFDLWWVTRQGLTVLLKDTLTGKPSVNRTVWSVGIYCQRRMCAWVMRVIHLWYEHTNIQTDIHTHTQWWISNKTGIFMSTLIDVTFLWHLEKYIQTTSHQQTQSIMHKVTRTHRGKICAAPHMSTGHLTITIN